MLVGTNPQPLKLEDTIGVEREVPNGENPMAPTTIRLVVGTKRLSSQLRCASLYLITWLLRAQPQHHLLHPLSWKPRHQDRGDPGHHARTGSMETSNKERDDNDPRLRAREHEIDGCVLLLHTPSVPKKESFLLPKKSTTFNFDQIYLTKY
jgi:hypothetical protein